MYEWTTLRNRFAPGHPHPMARVTLLPLGDGVVVHNVPQMLATRGIAAASFTRCPSVLL